MQGLVTSAGLLSASPRRSWVAPDYPLFEGSVHPLDLTKDLHGRTLNPGSAAHASGGSSSAAAAAAAAGIGAIAHGNDIGGSIRYPAYACGIVALRPSAGRISAFNPSAAAERPLDCPSAAVEASAGDWRQRQDAEEARRRAARLEDERGAFREGIAADARPEHHDSRRAVADENAILT